MEYFFRTLLLFLAEDALQLAGQSTVTNLSLIPLFLPEGRGRESVQPDAADNANCTDWAWNPTITQ